MRVRDSSQTEDKDDVQGALIMKLLHLPARGRMEAAEVLVSEDGDGAMKTEIMQADARFLKNIFLFLALTTCLLGAAAFVAML